MTLLSGESDLSLSGENDGWLVVESTEIVAVDDKC
jgi:hypothetical protein